jgi:hypothetical protein
LFAIPSLRQNRSKNWRLSKPILPNLYFAVPHSVTSFTLLSTSSTFLQFLRTSDSPDFIGFLIGIPRAATSFAELSRSLFDFFILPNFLPTSHSRDSLDLRHSTDLPSNSHSDSCCSKGAHRWPIKAVVQGDDEKRKGEEKGGI